MKQMFFGNLANIFVFCPKETNITKINRQQLPFYFSPSSNYRVPKISMFSKLFSPPHSCSKLYINWYLL